MYVFTNSALTPQHNPTTKGKKSICVFVQEATRVVFLRFITSNFKYFINDIL